MEREREVEARERDLIKREQWVVEEMRWAGGSDDLRKLINRKLSDKSQYVTVINVPLTTACRLPSSRWKKGS